MAWGFCSLGHWLRKKRPQLVPRRSRVSQSTHSFIILRRQSVPPLRAAPNRGRHSYLMKEFSKKLPSGLVSSGLWSCLALVEIQGREVSKNRERGRAVTSPKDSRAMRGRCFLIGTDLASLSKHTDIQGLAQPQGKGWDWGVDPRRSSLKAAMEGRPPMERREKCLVGGE